VVIGRKSEQIQLTDNGASRRHAEILREDGAWMLVDLNSSNGTYLNGRRLVGQARLKHGDQIRVGRTLLVFSGREQVEGLTGPNVIRDLVDLDMSDRGAGESSIVTSLTASEESVILPPPETADAVAAWNVLYQIAGMIGTVEPIEAFLNRAADVVVEYIIVDRLVLLLEDGQTGELTPQVVRYRPKPRTGKKPKIVTSRTIINHVLKTKNGVLCANAMTDARFTTKSSHDSIHRLGLRSIICVPVIAHEKVHGIIHLDCSTTHHTYTEEQLRLALAIGALTGMAVENARLMESRVRTERLAAGGETVAYLSHHIRNIVQGLQGGADVIETGIENNDIETVSSGWSVMKRNLERTFHLTTNMLTFSKNRQPFIQSAKLSKTIRDVVDLVRARADERSVTLLEDLEDIGPVPFDPDGIHQVVHNILLNAIEAAPVGTGRVRVKTARDPHRGLAIVSISDNGSGIPPERIDRVFDAFVSSKGQGGTGLGLAAARKIVAEHKGEIHVDSTVDEGTTFHVRIPLTDIGQTNGDETATLKEDA
jgi:two-component system NtrC family sensor kinase